MTDAPFSVENEVVEDVGRSETTAENGGETETTATNESETGIENVMEQGETKNETAYHENTNETDSHEKLAGEKVQIHDSRGEREPQNLNSENEESKTEDKESETDPPKRLEDNQVVDNEEYSELSKTDNPDDYHENDNPVVNINSGTDEKLDSSGFEENNVQPKSEDKELQAADKDQNKEISDSAELEKMPR